MLYILEAALPLKHTPHRYNVGITFTLIKCVSTHLCKDPTTIFLSMFPRQSRIIYIESVSKQLHRQRLT